MKFNYVPVLFRSVRFHLIPIFLLAAGLTSELPAQTVIFSDGFEEGLNGWAVGDNNPEGTPAYWGVVDAAFGGEGTRGGTNKAYCAGVGYETTTGPLSPNYRADMAAFMQRTIDLTGYTNATLSFWHKIPTIEPPSLGQVYDYVLVLMDNSVIYSNAAIVTTWTQVSVSLEPFIGGPHTLQFLFVSDFSEQREGWYLDDILVTDSFTPGPPPSNDRFETPVVLLGAVGCVSGHNGSATLQVGEPTGGFNATNSIWYRWQAVTNGPVTFRTGGSAFDTILCVYTGNTVSALTPVACDDNGDTNSASLVSFNAVLGVVYRIAVRGANNARGAVQLCWNQPGGVGVELLPDIQLWVDESRGYLYGWYLDREEPTKPGRTLLRASTATVNLGKGALELRGSSLTPGVNQRIYRTDGSYRENYAGTFTFHAGHQHLHFDNWLNFNLRQVLPSNGVGNIVVAGDKTSFAIIDLERYVPSVPGAPANPVYDATLVQGISAGWADVYGASLLDQWIDVTGVPPGRYWLEAVVDPQNRVIEENESNNVARLLIDLIPPPEVVPNDYFTNSIVLTGVSAAVTGSNANATKEPGEPQHWPGNPGGASVWYRWTAPSNMNVVVSTDGSSFDTLLAVYTGSAINGLVAIAQNDDVSPDRRSSRVSFMAFANTTYRIAVDGLNGAEGSVELSLNPAWNNDFSRPIQLSGFAGSTAGSTRGATRQSGEPLHAGVNGTNSIWYLWTAPTNGPFTFDTTGSGFDTVLAVYTGAAFPLTQVAANDNLTPSNNASRVTFDAVSGTTYRIAVDGFPGQLSTGLLKLSWNGPMPPTIVAPPASTNLPAGATALFSVGVSGTAPFHYQWRHAGTNLTDDGGHISGANSATLSVAKILTPDAGSYSVVVSNAWGTATSAPGNLIVIDNPRVVYINHYTAPIGGVATVPLNMQAMGDESVFKFSVAFDPAVLTNPRLAAGADAPGASILLNTTMLNAGRLGVSLSLPLGQTLPVSSTLELARVTFDVNGAVSHGTETTVGFANQPVAKSILGTNDTPVIALYTAGSVTLEDLPATASGRFLADGTFQLSLTGAPGQSYVIEATTNLTAQAWEAVATNQTTLNGLLQFVDPNATNTLHRFFRARLTR